MKIPEGWVLVPREPTEEMRREGRGPMPVITRFWQNHEGRHAEIVYPGHADYVEPDGAYKAMLAAAPPPPTDPEVAAGVTMDGYAGAVFRLIDRCDYREVQGWMRAEIIRGTAQDDIINAAAAAVEAIALQCAGLVTRSQMRQFARAILTKAAMVLEDDIKALVDAKKADTVLANRIRIVVPGT